MNIDSLPLYYTVEYPVTRFFGSTIPAKDYEIEVTIHRYRHVQLVFHWHILYLEVRYCLFCGFPYFICSWFHRS